MYYIKRFLKYNFRFYGKIALATGLLFIFQGLGVFFLLKDTAGRAGFELFSDLSELTFVLILLFSLLYNALHTFRIMQNCRNLIEGEETRKMKLMLFILFSFLVLIATVLASFFFADIFRYLVSSFFTTKDNFDRLCIFDVLQIHNFREYCLGGPVYVKMNLIGCLVMVSSMLSFCGFMFKRNILVKTFMVLLFIGLATTGIILSGRMNDYWEKCISSNVISFYYISFLIELSVSCIALGACNILYKKYLSNLNF